MAFSFSRKNFEQIELERWMRPEHLSRVIVVLRAAIGIYILYLLVLIPREFLYHTISQVLNPPTQNSALDAQTPPAVLNTGNHDFSEIVSKNIFGPLGPPVTATEPKTKPVTLLPLDLIGTFVSNKAAPYAIIENKKKNEQDVFRINELIFGEAKLVAIYPDRVEIERNGQTEVLNLEQEGTVNPKTQGGVVAVSDDQFVVDSGELDRALDNMPLLLQQARAVPYFKEGKSVGLRLFAVKPDSLFSKLGLRNGDVMKSVNGKNLADLSQALKLFEDLKQDRAFSVMLERNQEEKEFKYEIR